MLRVSVRGVMGEAPANSRSSTKRIVYALLLLSAILAAASYLRLYRLADQGILAVDEGRYVLDALAARAELEAYHGLLSGKLEELRGGPDFSLANYLRETDAKLRVTHPFAPKPGYAVACAVAMMLTGNIIAACSYVEAAFGILTVAVLFGFIWHLRNARAAIIASALLAISIYHIYYSRNAYPQTSTGALFLIAVWCHYAWQAKCSAGPKVSYLWPSLCGVVLGLSFWFNYQIAGALPAFAIVHVLACARLRSFRHFAFGGLAIASGFIVVMLAAEARTYPLMLLFRSYGLVYPNGTFLELLGPRVIGQSDTPFNIACWPLLPYFLSVTESWAYVAAILIPPIAAALHVAFRAGRNPKAAYALLLHPAIVYSFIPFIAIWTVFSFKTMQGARTFVTALPFLFALTAIGIDYAFARPARFPRFMLAPAALCFAVSLFLFFPAKLREVESIRSAYPCVIEYTRAQKPPAACAAWSAVLEAYGLANGVETKSIYAYRNSGLPLPPVYVSDWQELYNQRHADQPAALPPGAISVHTMQQDFGRMFLTIEALPSFGNTFTNIRWTEGLDLDAARKILIYNP